MAERAPYDARSVANFLLDLADERGVTLTQISLLKIIYFAHGWHLSINGSPLIAHEFEAWQYGPVIKVVRDEFKSFGPERITSRAQKLNIQTGEKISVDEIKNYQDQIFIERIFDAYHIHDAWKLSELTHEAGSPWDRVWNSIGPMGRLGLRIRNSDIKKHFDSLPRRFVLS